MQQFIVEREIYNIKNPRSTCNEFNILINLISLEYKYLATDEGTPKAIINCQSKNIFLGDRVIYIKPSRHSPIIRHMSLYLSPVYNLLTTSDNDTLIIGDNLLHLFCSNKKLITNTDGMWISVSDFIVYISTTLQCIDVYNLDLDLIDSQKHNVKDVYKNSFNTIMFASLSYDKLITVYEFIDGSIYSRDSVILLMDESSIFSICKFHTGVYIIQYILKKSHEFLCTSFRFNEIINTFTCVPIAYTHVLPNHTLAFSNECFFILSSHDISDITDYKFTPHLYHTFSFHGCIPVVTLEENVIYIKRNQNYDYFLCITKVHNLSTYERPIPNFTYTYINYNKPDSIISLGTIHGVVVEFDFFY